MGTKVMYIFLKLAKFIPFSFGLFVFCACLKCGNYVLFRLMLILSEKKSAITGDRTPVANLINILRL